MLRIGEIEDENDQTITSWTFPSEYEYKGVARLDDMPTHNFE